MTDDDGDPWRHRREALKTAFGYFLDQAERSSLGLMACLHTNGSDVRRTATAVRHAREAAHGGRLALAIKSMVVVLLVVGLAGGVEAQEDLWTPSIEQAGAVVMAEAVSAQSVSLWPLSAVLRGTQNAPCWVLSSDLLRWPHRAIWQARSSGFVSDWMYFEKNARFSQETSTWISRNRIGSTWTRLRTIGQGGEWFGIARSGFYVWKKAYETYGDEGLVNQKPCPYTTHGSAHPPTSSRRASISAAAAPVSPSAPSTSSGVSSALTASRFRKPGSPASSGATA